MKRLTSLACLVALMALCIGSPQELFAANRSNGHFHRPGRSYSSICQKDFKTKCKSSKTYKIKSPGTYTLKENISFNPVANDIPAILICASDVVLNLNGKTLKQSPCSKFDRITGITVAAGNHNVTILGNYGEVSNFSQRGIYVEGDNKHVTISDNLIISGNGYGTQTAFFDGKNPLIQCGLQLGDQEFMTALKAGEFHGILEHVKITDVSINNNNIGILLGEGSNYEFNNVDDSNNSESRPMWSYLSSLGFFIPNSTLCYGLAYFSNPEVTPAPNFGIQNIKFYNCKFNNNVADASVQNLDGAYTDAFIMAVNFKGLKIDQCQFNSNRTVLSETGLYNRTRGLVLGSGFGSVIENSEFNNNVGGNQVVGFNLSGLIANPSGAAVNNFQAESVTLRQNVASDNVANPVLNALFTFPANDIPAVGAYGFILRYPNGARIVECVGEGNVVRMPDPGRAVPPVDNFFAIADGIFIYSDTNFPNNFSNNIEVESAKLSYNRVVYDNTNLYFTNFYPTSSGLRIYDDLCENVVVRRSVMSNNVPGFNETPNPLPSNYVAGGVDLFNAIGFPKTGPSYVTLVENVIKSNGTYGVYNNLDRTDIRNNLISDHGAGVFMDVVICDEAVCPQDATRCTVLDNTFTYNFFSVFDVSNNPSTNAVAGNETVSCAIPGEPDTYLVFYGPGATDRVPVEVGTLPNYPNYPPSKQWTNIELDACGEDQAAKNGPDLAIKFGSKKYMQKALEAKHKLFGKKK